YVENEIRKTNTRSKEETSQDRSPSLHASCPRGRVTGAPGYVGELCPITTGGYFDGRWNRTRAQCPTLHCGRRFWRLHVRSAGEQLPGSDAQNREEHGGCHDPRQQRVAGQGRSSPRCHAVLENDLGHKRH